jgi:uncharacterized protein YndB with AHSA1/START domain
VPALPRETGVVEYEVRIAARPETVFAYFTDPIKMVQWMGAEATLDPRPGGVCRIASSDSGVMMGEFVEVDPYQRIVLTWGWEQKLLAKPSQSTLVEVSFIPDGEDTILQLAQRRRVGGSGDSALGAAGDLRSPHVETF